MESAVNTVRRVVLASGNAGKLRELEALLAPLDLDVVSQAALGITAAEEPYCTFIENALAKARHASAQSGLPALADDSGICVAALDGQPGVHSARFAGEPCADARNNAKLIDLLRGCADRRAYYQCVVVFLRRADDPQPLLAEGRWAGEIIDLPRGAGGFGYDPHFFVPALGCTAAELDAAQKDAHSHRGIALRRLMARLREEL